VADADGHCVWKIKTDHKVDKWLNVEKVVTLSVTSEGHIAMLIAVDVRGGGVSSSWFGTVTVYDTDGVKLSSMKLPRDIVNPGRAMQTANKSLIVCHGDRATELNRVCEVNNEGVAVKSYGGSRGSQIGQLITPLHFALDSEERIFVADFGNRRVLLLSQQLEIKRVLLRWTDDGPLAVFYDRETTQLMIALWSGKVEVYSLL
jgi:hypothetical protein